VPDAPNRGEMPFLDHLEELRWRILYSLAAVLVGSVIGWFVVQNLDVIGLLMRPIAPLLPGRRLMFTSPTEPFFITLKFAFAVGLLLASPVVIYQIWAFLTPALYDKEKRLIIPALSVGVLLFLAGAAVAYLWVLPRALAVLFSFQRNDLAPIITADNYFGFAAQIIIAFGIVTELPLVIVILASLGLVTPQFLARNRRYALVIAAFAAALLTPPDALSMLMMMVPLVLLYEISILCAWVVTRRRERRAAREAAAPPPAQPPSSPPAAAVALLLLCGGVGGLWAQNPPPPVQRPDTTHRQAPGQAGPGVAGQPVTGRTLDTAAARKLGLPTGPTRSFPPSDSAMDALLQLKGYRITRYVADTLLVLGDSQVIFLRGQAFVDREGTKLEADSIRYQEASCRLDAVGDPRLFDQNTVLVGEGMRYDTCIRRGTVTEALTSFPQGGATWYMRGDLAVDSGSTRMFGAKSKITSDDHPDPDYHFATNEVKWLNKNVMVARPAVLYVRDVPILWLPFMFQDIRAGRRSGILVPRFGLNDLVRPTRGYERHISNVGYYFVLNDYIDLLTSVDWFAGRNVSIHGQMRYRWLDRFISGGISYTRLSQLDAAATSSRIGWQHSQAFDSRTRFNASIDYATSARVVQRNTADPFLSTAQLTSSANFDKRFGWGTFNLGGSRSQNLSNDLVQQNFPRMSLTPSPINITPAITWSPGFSFNNAQTFHAGPVPLLAAANGGVDTLPGFFDTRQTDLSISTPLRVGRWNWSNSITVGDRSSNQRTEFLVPDSTDSTSQHHLLYGRTFSTTVDWQTSINLPQLFSGTWKLQPGIAILNTTTAGPFAIRNQFTGGQFIHQGKRLSFSLGMAPTFFGFFPGVGPLSRIRHTVQWLVGYQYAPAAKVPTEYAHAIDPTGRSLNARSDPQQTISLGLSQNFEGKFKPTPGDTSREQQPRKLRLLSINTSPIAYNFEQAKIPGHTGWQTQALSNTFASELLPGFSLQTTHDLWRGPVGDRRSKFAPFLTTVSASFSVSPGTLRALGGLIGLAGGGGGSPPVTPGAPPPPGSGPVPPIGGPPPYGGGGGIRGANPSLPSGGQGFHMSVQFSSNRSRPDTTTSTLPSTLLGQTNGGRQQASINMGFSPTPHWTLSWNTTYDLDTKQFGQHAVRLERDLHRWHASFAFYKSPNGNFAFNFYISLLDQPDIKFDYDQQTYKRP
jgi:Tat protein translocase TatC